MRLALALLVLSASLAAQDYSVSHLDVTGTTVFGTAAAICRTGDFAAGTAQAAGASWSKPARWMLGQPTTILPILLGDETGSAWGINDAGQVVGESIDVKQQGQLTIFTEHGVAWLGALAVPLSSFATSGDTDIVPFVGVAITNHSEILGWGKRPGVDGVRGFVLQGGVMTDLGSLQGTPTGSAMPAAINEQGVVVGASTAPDFFTHAFVWQGGVMQDLHVISGVPGRNSHAAAINEAGTVVGDADPTADFLDYQSAAVWQDGVVTFLPDLGDVGGVIESFARDVNDHGTIVGTSVTPTFEVHAVTWRDGQCVDLNTLIPPGTGWLLANANSISNDGRIVGEGFTPSGIQSFVLVPDSAGGFEVYGAGTPGSGAFVPGLWGEGWAESGGEISLAVTNGLGGAAGLMLVGLDDQTAPFKGGTLSVLPLSPLSVPLLLSAGGAGGGQWTLPLMLPPSVPAGSLFLQAMLADGGATGGATLTNAVRVDLAP